MVILFGGVGAERNLTDRSAVTGADVSHTLAGAEFVPASVFCRAQGECGPCRSLTWLSGGCPEPPPRLVPPFALAAASLMALI